MSSKAIRDMLQVYTRMNNGHNRKGNMQLAICNNSKTHAVQNVKSQAFVCAF